MGCSDDTAPATSSSGEAAEPLEDCPSSISPLAILFLGCKSVVRKIIKACDTTELNFQKFNEFLKVYPETVENEAKIISILKEENIGYFRHQNQYNTNFRVILLGLSCDTACQEIVDALNEKDFVVNKVVQIQQNKTRVPLPSFRVDIVRIGNYRSIFKLRRLLDIRVRVRPFYKIPKNIQCYSCQKLGHSYHFCSMGTRCRFCALEHPSRTCPTRDDPSTYRCANCGKPHMSSSMTCLYRRTGKLAHTGYTS